MQREQLSHLEDRLFTNLSTEDWTVLHQRVTLLTKQWIEMTHQLNIRSLQLSNKLDMWKTFSTRFNYIQTRINQTHGDIKSTTQSNIEDLLAYLQTVCENSVSVKLFVET